MPRKPTAPFGHIRFPKHGKPTKEIFKLSPIKDQQEREVMERFVQLHRDTWDEPRLEAIRQLDESDFDFSGVWAGNPIVIELTEIARHTYVTPTDDETLKSRRLGEDLHLLHAGSRTYIVDIRKKNAALTDVIRGKVAKRYAKPKGTVFWLVIFAVDSYLAEYIEQGQLYMSEALAAARDYLQGLTSQPFDAIWFIDLQTRPVRVWPVPPEALKTKGTA